ncbi:MAG TPA: glycosyltransferase family 4 protein [Candidatus Binatia bacterium]|nr:glycosyltransferase family 4 protein [Candidatus Binatia bacterium]
MRIAFHSTMEGYAWGGSEELWSRAALRLREQGVEVHASVKAWPQVPRMLQQLIDAGVVVHRRRPVNNRFYMRVLRRRGWISRDPELDRLRALAPDLLVVSLGSNFEARELIAACRIAGMRYALVNQAVQDVWSPTDAAKTEHRENYEQATACFCLAQSNLRSLQRQLASPLSNARIVRNPFNVPYDARPPWPADDGIVRLAVVGRLEPYSKAQDLLLEALAGEKWRQRPVQFLFYGDGPLKGYLRDLARHYGVTNAIFAGTVDDIPQLWSRHHALVLTSRIEGMSLAAIEAMLCARPCIVTQVAGCEGELVQDGLTGFVAAAPTAALIDDALERAWAQRGRWEEMGRRAAQHVRTIIPRDPAAEFAASLVELVSTADRDARASA